MPDPNQSEKLPSTFEDAMAELETIVQELEASRMPLSDLVGNYERGTKLLKFCRGEIQVARQRVEKITLAADDDDDGAGDEVSAASAEAPVAKKSSKSRVPKAPDDDDVRLF